jgi:hypothetical protein
MNVYIYIEMVVGIALVILLTPKDWIKGDDE